MRAIGGRKAKGSGAGLKANRHGLKGMVAAQVVMVGADAHLTLFTNVARPDLLGQKRIDAFEIEEVPFEVRAKGPPGTAGRWPSQSAAVTGNSVL